MTSSQRVAERYLVAATLTAPLGSLLEESEDLTVSLQDLKDMVEKAYAKADRVSAAVSRMNSMWDHPGPHRPIVRNVDLEFQSFYKVFSGSKQYFHSVDNAMAKLKKVTKDM